VLAALFGLFALFAPARRAPTAAGGGPAPDDVKETTC
jgi:hypothetical protein